MASPKPRKGFNLGVIIKVLWRAATEKGFTDQLRVVLGQPPAAAPSLPPPPQPAPQPATQPAATQPALLPPAPKPTGDSVRLLTLFQREGRLVDFLMEEIAGFEDAQIGAAVREIHEKCRKVLAEHVRIEGVVAEAEDEKTTVPSGFDPSAIQVTGNLVGSPPFQGTVRHRGWRVKEVTLPPVPANQDPMVLAPAEVEVS